MDSAQAGVVVATVVILIPLGSVALGITSLRTPQDIRGRLNLLDNEPRTEKEIQYEASLAGLASFGYVTLLLGLIMQALHTLETNPIDLEAWIRGGLGALVGVGIALAKARGTYRRTLENLRGEDESQE